MPRSKPWAVGDRCLTTPFKGAPCELAERPGTILYVGRHHKTLRVLILWVHDEGTPAAAPPFAVSPKWVRREV